MRKIGPTLALCLMLAALPASSGVTAGRALAQPAIPNGACDGQAIATPLQGHYTGPWHSDGDYHFYVFNTDLDLKIIIDGTLDLTVTDAGQVYGKVTGKLDAPITHDGKRDVSSGFGTISGNVTGTITSSGASLVLHTPTIDMHWGTFLPGGATVERFITMPDYQLGLGSFDCVSASGTIAENGFPKQFIVADGAGQMTESVGIGVASGTWRITSDKASDYSSLSSQVDSFISGANAVLNSPTPLTSHLVEKQIATPLRNLVAQITADPTLSRCLLNRLLHWEAGAVRELLQESAASEGTATIAALRQAGDFIRAAELINQDCGVDVPSAKQVLFQRELTGIGGAIAQRDWAQAALLAREALLLGGSSGRESVEAAVNGGFAKIRSSSSGSNEAMEAARAAYTLGDVADARSLALKVGKQAAVTPTPSPTPKPKKKSSKPHKPRKSKKGTRKPTPTPTATPKPAAPSTEQLLAAGVPKVNATVQDARISWAPVNGAVSYVVGLMDNRDKVIGWTWSGTSTTVPYGDTAITDLASSKDDGWSIGMSGKGYTVTILALGPDGHIRGFGTRAVK